MRETLPEDGDLPFPYTSPWWMSEEARGEDTDFVADDQPISEADVAGADQDAQETEFNLTA